MNCIKIAILILGVTCLISWTKETIVELPLTKKIGYGPFGSSSVGGMPPYSTDANNPWFKTYLKITGAPADWAGIIYGDIDLDIFQTVYQNYLAGNISGKWYEMLQKSWSWKPDTASLSKVPLKCKVAFAYGKDSSGQVNMVIDTNNNLDLSDDKPFKPILIDKLQQTNIDSFKINNSITISYEDFVGNKIVKETTPVFITYSSRMDMCLCNFPQYKTTKFNGVEIAVCSGNFTSLTYENPMIAIVTDPLKKGYKIDKANTFLKNENIEINGELYKNMGVNKNKNTLILERVSLPKNQQYSTQIGYQPYPFEGVDFKTNTPIVLSALKGKYVYLDFWASFCKPCLEEMPAIEKLYTTLDTTKVKFIGIVCETSSDALTKLLAKHSIGWPQILSTDTNNIREKYGVVGYPLTLLLDPEGVIIAKDIRGKELEDKLRSLIDK